MLKIIQKIYEYAKTIFELDGVLKEIKIRKDVKQGDVSSPKIFTLILQDIFDKLIGRERASEWIGYGSTILTLRTMLS